jgi:ferrous iron transport protein A
MFLPLLARALPAPVSSVALRLVPTPQVMPLAALREGQSAQVIAVHEAGLLGERLMEMGLTPGTRLRLVRSGVRNAALQLKLRGYTLCLGQLQAQHIDVLPVP